MDPQSRLRGLQATPKPVPRARAIFGPKTPSTTTKPYPLSSHNSNTHDIPPLPQGLSPKDGHSSVKIKIKSATTPEARSRVLVKPLGARLPGAGPGTTPSIKLVTKQPEHKEPGLFEDDWMGIPTEADPIIPSYDSYEEDLAETEAVQVSIRVRPPNSMELRMDSRCVWTMPEHDQHALKLAKGTEGSREDRDWLFDRILPPHCDNAKAYGTSARTHVRSAMEGYNAVIFAYGQTASGKTHTLTGSSSEPGIIPLSISDIFAQIRSTPDREYLLRASYIELYNETIFDLLHPNHGHELHLSETKKGVTINGLTEAAVRTESEVRRLLRSGEEKRRVGATDWNSRSSRSHCVFRITIESRARSLSGDDAPKTPGRNDKTTRISTLSIIDLAGSEKHTSSKERNAEGRHINQSLLTLKLVISKLADLASKRNVTHIPYRDSKLTRLLQNSLSGDALISVICTVSPSALNLAESISTLAFAQGLKRVVLKAQKKEIVDPQALIQQYQNEIADLKAQLRAKEEGGGTIGSKSEKEKNEAMEKRLNELRSMILTSVNVRSPNPGDQAYMPPPSPATMKYPKLDYDRSTAELQEELHAEQLCRAELEDEVARLREELATRPLEPNAQIIQLRNENSELKLIADDYERNLREPSRKVREDVEKEYIGKMKTLENQLDSKKIWANRLDENVRFLTAENKQLQARCADAEAKVSQIIEWINTALASADVQSQSPLDLSTSSSQPLGSLVVSNDDFAPSISNQTKNTLTLSASKMQATFSQMDLANFNNKFGSLTMNGRGKGMNGVGRDMVREESHFDLAEVASDDEMF
ncbi:centromeric protein E [Cryptococcus gattii Ru294]|nr:centromeric protein E [Cryptococcus gattii Ru294]